MKQTTAEQPAPLVTWMSVASVFIFIHLFCLLLAFSGSLMRSQLQDQLLRNLFRPYLQPLNFDPDATPYHLTRGMADDVDHRWEVLPEGADAAGRDAWVSIPQNTNPLSESHKRWQRSAKLVAFQAAQENEDAAAEIALGVARYTVHHLKIRAQQIRCRRLHEGQTWGDGTTDPREFPYVANVVISDKGRVSIARVSDRRETALPETENRTTTNDDTTPDDRAP